MEHITSSSAPAKQQDCLYPRDHVDNCSLPYLFNCSFYLLKFRAGYHSLHSSPFKSLSTEVNIAHSLHCNLIFLPSSGPIYESNSISMYKSSSSLLGLRRSKSTSSVSHTSHPSTTLIDDPVIISAHQHALAAANHAFARAGGRENVRPDTATAADRASLMGGGGGMEVIHEGLVGEQGMALRRSESQRSVASG